MRTLLGALWLLAATAAIAQAPVDHLGRYRSHTATAIYLCRLALDTALLEAEAQVAASERRDWRGCLLEQRTEGKRLLDASLKVTKKPAVQAALKSYHVSFIAALDGIEPAPDERRISYRARQAGLTDKVNEAWARVEVEQ